MFTRKKTGLLFAVLALFVMVLVSCTAEPDTVVEQVEVTRVVTETVVEEGETVEVTRVVTEVEEVVVEVTPEGMGEVEAGPAPTKEDPTVFTYVTFGDVSTLDPALSYDTASSNLIENVMEGLIWYNGPDGATFVPVLATDVPSAENGGISEDGLTYTFNIREGVTFHEGGTLEPHDVAYSFHRGLLQSDPSGPQWIQLEPILGYTSGDVTEEIADGEYAGDPDGLQANASAEELAATCEKVKAAVVADDEAGTVTITLAQPYPFLSVIANSWAYVMDMEWAMENGAWDNDCATWQNWYAPGVETAPLTAIINGTGPYRLDSWTPGEGYILEANENYWRTDDMPAWEGGPAGQPQVKTINYQIVEEWGTRFAMLQAGDADWVTVNPENRPQVDEFVGEFCDYETGECTPNPDNPDGPLQKWGELPSVSRTDVFMVFNVPENSPYIGSGQLDGNGIPPDFFSDIDVRMAMNYCFDYQTYIDDALNGEGVRNNGPIILGMLGYNPDGEMYEFDLEQCEAHLAQAWGGVLPETGFRFQIGFNTGNTARQTVGEILQANLASINPLYQVDTVGMPWPTFLRSFFASQLPMYASGWAEDYHDPHNWVQPFTVGTYGATQNMPEDLVAQFQALVNAGVQSIDPAEREQIYYELQQLHHDQAIQVTLAQAAGANYLQRWVNDWYYRVGQFGGYWYAYGIGE